MKKGWEILKEFIEINDIRHIFGNPGTTETSFLAALTECPTLEYILGLQESTVIGIAAGYAMVTKKPAIVNVHTYPGLANSLCNLYNAFTSGVPLLITAGQQDLRHLIHKPVLSGNLTQLVESAVKYACEVKSIDDFAVLLQRCYIQAMLPPTGPAFISIPMNILDQETAAAYFKKTQIQQIKSADASDIASLAQWLEKVPAGRLVFIADYEVGLSEAGITALAKLAERLSADIYTSPFHVRSVISGIHAGFKGHLPALSSDINRTLSQYDTIVLLGEKIATFLFTGEQSMPKDKKLIHISATSQYLGFDYPCDLCLLGDIGATLQSVLTYLGPKTEISAPVKNEFMTSEDELKKMGKTAGMIHRLLSCLDQTTPIVTEGSSEDGIIQKLALEFYCEHVHFSPRGGGLGWAMPVAVGIALATKKHSVCFVGDGGSLYAIHAIWTAKKYKIPVIFICFINQEYRILKELWCREKGTDINHTQFIGLDFEPPIDFIQLAQSFGAAATTVSKEAEIPEAIKNAMMYQGPSFIGVV